MSIIKKIKWFLAILCVFLVILATNLIDKKNFLRVEEAVENIYTDRLLAKELLLDVSIKFHEKELAYALNDSNYLQSQNYDANDKISKLLQLFDRTEATHKEEILLLELNKHYERLVQLESNTKATDTLYNKACAEIFSKINSNIKELSKVQVQEGKNQKLNARNSVDTAKLFSKIEIYILIFLALILQAIILYNPKKKKHRFR